MLAATVETTSVVATATLIAVPPLMSAAWMVSAPLALAPVVPVVPPKPVVAPVSVSWSLIGMVTGVLPTAPAWKLMDLSAVVPIVVASIVNDELCQEASWRTWVTVACIDWMVVVIEVRPLSAALSVFTPLVIELSRLESSVLRVVREAAVKKLTALSRAELTFLPVASRVWVRS